MCDLNMSTVFINNMAISIYVFPQAQYDDGRRRREGSLDNRHEFELDMDIFSPSFFLFFVFFILLVRQKSDRDSTREIYPIEAHSSRYYFVCIVIVTYTSRRSDSNWIQTG